MPLTTATDGLDHLVWFGGRKDEVHPFWGLFQELKKGVEGLVRQHMHFIDDKHTASTCRSNTSGLLKFTDMVDAIMASTVDLLDVHRVTGADLETSRALIARRWRGSLFTVECFRQNSGCTGFTNASGATK